MTAHSFAPALGDEIDGCSNQRRGDERKQKSRTPKHLSQA